MGENENTNFVEKRQNRPSELRWSGVPPSTIYKDSKNIQRTQFWSAKIKTRTLSKNVKIDPQEYVIRGPPMYYLQKLEKHRPHSVLMGENEYTNFVEIRQNRPSVIRLAGVPPL